MAGTEKKITLNFKGRLKDRAYIIRFCLFFACFLLLGGVVLTGFFVQEKRARYRLLSTDESRQVEFLGKVAESDIKSIAYDLIYLSNHPLLFRWLGSGEFHHRTDLARAYLAFAGTGDAYDQIRFLDTRGQERIRIHRKGDRLVVASANSLQDKGKRYYFKDTLKLSPGEIYVSPLDLNMENGRLERPLKPVIRFGIPVNDVDGRKMGVVILNYRGQRLLEDLGGASHGMGNPMLLNPEGYWIKGLNPEDQWGFMFPDRKGRTMARLNPGAWERITAADRGQFEAGDGLYTFTTVRPLGYGMRSSSGAPPAAEASPGTFPGKDFHWKIVMLVPSETLRAMTLGILMGWAPHMGILLLVLTALSGLGSHAATRRMEIRRELQESETAMRSIFRAAPTGIGMVRDRVFIQLNERVCEMSGYTAPELLGRGSRILYPTDEEFTFVGEEKYRQISEKGTGTVETRWRQKSGHVIDVLLSSTPVDPSDLSRGVTFTALDISRQKEAEAALRSTTDTLSSILASSTEYAIVATDLDLGIIHYNPTAERMFGVPRDKALGVTVWEIHRSRGIAPELLDRALAVVHASGKFDFELPHRDGNGELHTLMATLMPMKGAEGTAVNGYIMFAKDITELRQMEGRLAQSHKMEAMGTLAGGVAHDFNNILGGIMGYAQLARMKCGGEDPRLPGYIDQILSAGRRATGLVQQILTFTRRGAPEKKPCDISIAVKEALKLIRASIPTTVEIRSSIKKDAGVVLADPTQIHQVMMNLCTNAAHAMEAFGGVLEVTLGALSLDGKTAVAGETPATGAYLLLRVTDTGEGIDPALLSRIFDPYFTTRQVGEGTGMGLATVHGIVKDHGGEIFVESTPGRGSAFHVLLPVAEQERPEPNVSPSDCPGGAERILLVDDEASLVEVGEQMLEELGYTVESRTSSAEALALFMLGPDRFDLVITDMTMPEMTGEDLAREIKNVRPEQPILLCTGFSSRMNPERAEEVGIDGYLAKPLLLRNLALAVRELLDR